MLTTTVQSALHAHTEEGPTSITLTTRLDDQPDIRIEIAIDPTGAIEFIVMEHPDQLPNAEGYLPQSIVMTRLGGRAGQRQVE